MGGHRGAQAPRRVVEGAADLAERQTEPAQQADAVQPLDVGVGVEPVARRRVRADATSRPISS